MSSTEEPTIGRLVVEASRDISALIQSEIALAKSELRVSVRSGGVGAVLIVVALFLLLLATVLGSVTIGFFLTMTGMHAAWAFLIVTGVYLLLAILLILFAVFKFKKVKPPRKTIATAKQIPGALKGESTYRTPGARAAEEGYPVSSAVAADNTPYQPKHH